MQRPGDVIITLVAKQFLVESSPFSESLGRKYCAGTVLKKKSFNSLSEFRLFCCQSIIGKYAATVTQHGARLRSNKAWICPHIIMQSSFIPLHQPWISRCSFLQGLNRVFPWLHNVQLVIQLLGQGCRTKSITHRGRPKPRRGQPRLWLKQRWNRLNRNGYQSPCISVNHQLGQNCTGNSWTMPVTNIGLPKNAKQIWGVS